MLASQSLLFALTAATLAASQRDLDWIPFDRSQFNGSTALDTDGNVQLFWKTGDEYSTFGVASRSNGYLGLGFSETGAMTGADMALGFRDSNGTFVFENRHAQGFVTPEVSPDQTTNMRFKEGDQANGVTYFVFDKKNTAECLDTQTGVLNDSWQWFIYAFSDSNNVVQHADGHMGKQYVKLGTGADVVLNTATNVANAQNFTITQPELTIPANVTSYCYTLHKMPAGKRNFLIGERPHSSSSLLHHQVVYACYDLPDAYLDMIGKEANCDWQTFANPCNGFVTEWAPGMSARTFEPGYGKPFGEDLYEYAMLEVHYNNPEQLADVADTASYTFLWTDQQVETEIGTLTLGALQVEGWFLEPGRALVSHSTVCTPDCTSNWPAEGITAVAVFHHMHYRGVHTHVQIVRDGKELPPLSSLRDFEYGFQFSKNLNRVALLPGDRLITTCQYNTLNDTAPVPGGLPSQSEMCFAWVDYYPANKILACTQFDLGTSPLNPVNGSVGICLASDRELEIYDASSLVAEYEELPVTGNNCTEDGDDSGTPVGASILQTCTENDEICFAVNIPSSSSSSPSDQVKQEEEEKEEENQPIYLRLSAPTSYAWIALAPGTAMHNANFLVMYASADESNVTLSPRTSSGHVMPVHNPAVKTTLLAGSGIHNGRMTAIVRCTNCQSWRTGRLDFAGGGRSDWVYAYASSSSSQGAGLASDDLDAQIAQHDEHGAFQWDLAKAVGGSSANPFLDASSSTSSSSSSSSRGGDPTRLSQAHGSLAAITFLAIFPSGAILVRLASIPHLAWMHGGLQIFGYAIFIAAAGMGISLAQSNAYLQEPHAIIGLLLLSVLFFMPIVGAIQHRMYKKVQRRSVWSYGHIFTGRVAVVLGMVNGGLGLQLADAEREYKIAYGVLAGVVGVVYIAAVCFGEVKRAGRRQEGVSTDRHKEKRVGMDRVDSSE